MTAKRKPAKMKSTLAWAVVHDNGSVFCVKMNKLLALTYASGKPAAVRRVRITEVKT